MSHPWDRIVIGIGSPHGDDQFGWAVIDALDARSTTSGTSTLRKISNPIDLLYELDGYERVILVDAGVGLPENVPFLRLNFAEAHDRQWIQDLPSRSTHDFGLYQTLQMAQSLGKPTDHVRLWIGLGQSFAPMVELNETMSMAAHACAEAIAKELCDARNVAC